MRGVTKRAVGAMLALMVLFVPLGALAGVLVHWHVIQPSDEDLEAAARTLSDSPIASEYEPIASGQFAPTFTRGMVRWDVESDVLFDSVRIETAVAEAGWQVEEVSAESLHADRGAIRLDVEWRPSGEGWRTVVLVDRGRIVPSLTVTVIAGAVLGALAAVILIRWIERPRRPVRGGAAEG